jgi:hypothetical protein
MQQQGFDIALPGQIVYPKVDFDQSGNLIVIAWVQQKLVAPKFINGMIGPVA